MKTVLHQIDFYFIIELKHYKVKCIAFEDDSYTILVFKTTDGGDDIYRIGCFDFETQPTSKDAEFFLLKAI